MQIGNLSENHGGNQAVWDTVGANAQQPIMGTPPEHTSIGEWHFNEEGVPVAGPAPSDTTSNDGDRTAVATAPGETPRWASGEW